MVNKFRKLLIRFGKILPFFLCFIVLISYIESFVALYCQDYMSYKDFLNYTMLVKSILDAESNPQKVTLFDYNKRCDAYAKFVNKLKENHDNQYKMFL